MNAVPVLPGNWDGLVVYCSSTSWDQVARFHDHHLGERLPRYAPILFVDPPISHLTPWRRPDLAAALKGPRLRLIAPRLARLTPVVLPGLSRPGMRAVAIALTRRALRRAVRALGAPVHAVVISNVDGLFGAAGERRRVLYFSDDFVAGARLMSIPVGRVRREEQRRLQEADTLLVCSEALAEKWRALGYDPVVVPYGVDNHLFATTDSAAPPADVRLPAPIAGFIGHISDRIDLSLLEAVAARGRSLLLVGPRGVVTDGERMKRLLANQNVQWVGPRPFSSLPSYMRVIDVGLVPYLDTQFNRASLPLKTLEYLAAGRPVVATDLPAIRWLGTDLVEVASDARAFADAVDRAVNADSPPSLVTRRRALAAEHAWDRRAADFARALGLIPPIAPSLA